MSRLQLTVSEADFRCPVTGQIFFDPVVTACDHHIERAMSVKLQKCPCCNNENPQFKDATRFFKNTLQAVIAQNKLYENVYFDLGDFGQIIKENKLNTSIGGLFIELLKNATDRLNQKEDISIKQQNGTVTVANCSAIEILASTFAGRDLLRKKLKTESGRFFFGEAEILPESLKIQVDGKSIQEWLGISTAMEIMQEEEQKVRQEMERDAQTIAQQLQTDYQKMLCSQGLFRVGTFAAVKSYRQMLCMNKFIRRQPYHC